MKWAAFRSRPKRREIWTDYDWEVTHDAGEAFWMQCQECDYFGPDRILLHTLFDWLIPWRRA
jgi:hypothetical protein